MASTESSPTLDHDRKPSDEKQVGFNAPIDITGIDAPATLDPSHAAEYLEYLELKERFESDPTAYKSLVRRLDLRIIPMLFLYYLLNSLDKSNAGNVKIYTFLKDTHMTGHQFNLALTWYFFTYAFLEAPSNMCMRKFGPRLWLSGLVFCWGAATLGTAWVTSYHGYCATRVMLGVFEAGLFQGVYTLSCWYVSGELQTRCAYWYSATMVSGAFGGLLAYAVGGLQGRLGLKQWQNFISSASKNREDQVSPDEEFRWSAFWEAVKDWKTYFIASLLAFGGSVPTYSVNYTLATMVKSLGYSSIKAQALTAPPYVFAFFCVIAIAIYSDKYRCRARSLLISFVAGYNMQAPAVGSWLGTNVRNPAKRAAAMGWQSTFGQLLGGTIGANIFITKEAPTYQSGFIILLVLVMVGGVGATIANWYCLRASNRKKDKIPVEELEGKYTEQQLSEMGEYSPYFRYACIVLCVECFG
ncbi:High-affinity nicotinic acid transporter [Lachnellula willkommii]|uniref:High-affinity nicotinic acid transporter n=1 Tax=Lachnellula willkommii TaxID=215461 RepID=A0A559M8L0_9HELO|nr:High-affinity nicotinic acid transporter [Lachnellula willkommii]